jgi:hypothetical protein
LELVQTVRSPVHRKTIFTTKCLKRCGRLRDGHLYRITAHKVISWSRHSRERGNPGLLSPPIGLDTLNSQTKCNTFFIRCCDGKRL